MAKEARLVRGYPWQADEDKDERYTNEYGQQNKIKHVPDPLLLRNRPTESNSSSPNNLPRPGKTLQVTLLVLSDATLRRKHHESVMSIVMRRN